MQKYLVGSGGMPSLNFIFESLSFLLRHSRHLTCLEVNKNQITHYLICLMTSQSAMCNKALYACVS